MTTEWSCSDEALAAHSHARAHGHFAARSVGLVGFMGVGKTSVGQELARLLGRPFVDTDTVVENRSGRSIPELFEQGEPVFRTLEREAVRDALRLPPCVVALGGGAFSQPGLADLILANALVVHLYTPWSVMLHHLAELAADRPLIRGRATWQIQDLFLLRGAAYRRAHIRVCLPRRGPAEAAASVAEVLGCPPITVSDPPPSLVSSDH